MTEEQSAKLTREQFYNEIWEISVSGVAKKYNVPYNELLKLCKEANIPVPPSGYWIQLKFGKPVAKIPLPESSIMDVTLPENDKPKRIRLTAVKANVTETATMVQDDEPEEQTAAVEANKPQDSPLPYRLVHGEYNTYNREKLFEEVWAKPVVKVAEHYGVSDVTIHKICKELNVPLPPPGYWSIVRAGAEVERPPLPKTKGPTATTGARTYAGVKEKATDTPKKPLSFLTESEREKVFQAAQEIRLPAENAQLHKKIAAYRAVVKEWNKKDRRPEGAEKSLSNYYYHSDRPPFLAGVISNDSLPRVYRILDALFRQVERLGGSVNDDLSLRVRKEYVRIEIVEAQDKVKHVITRPEAQALIKYQDAKRHGSWASEPQIRKYDYVFNGKLRISVRQGSYFRDKDKSNVESRLGELLIALYEESEMLRLDREAREEETRKQAEAARRKEERRKRYNEEVERTIGLENAALDFETASRIRAYAKAVAISSGQDGLDGETAVWVDWALNKADWLDPTVARDDELFGKREHEKSSGEKALKKVGQYW